MARHEPTKGQRVPPPEPAGRPVNDPLWPVFAGFLSEHGFNRKLLADDAEWKNHGGPDLWALFLEGYEAACRMEPRLRRLEYQEEWARRGWANRIAAGKCPKCGRDRDNPTKLCDRCRGRQRAWKANYRNRLKGLGP